MIYKCGVLFLKFLLFNRQVESERKQKLSHDIITTKAQIKNLEFNALINKSPVHKSKFSTHHRVLIDFSRSKNL